MPPSPNLMGRVQARQGKLLAILTQAAREGAACPMNRELGERLNVGASVVIRDLAALERRGLVAIATGTNMRVVTILATGASTGGKVRGPSRRGIAVARGRTAERGPAPDLAGPDAENDDGHGPLSAAEIAARRVESGTCARCGVRLAAGCAHRPAPFGLSTSGGMGLNHG